MRSALSFVLVALVAAEVAGFILVGQRIGVLATLALLLASALVGAALLKRQGVAALRAARTEARSGRPPGRPLFDAALVAGAALLMIVPGFVTDIAGLLLFLPAVRARLWARLAARVAAGGSRRPARPASDPVIELGRDEYGSAPGPDRPWRRDGAP